MPWKYLILLITLGALPLAAYGIWKYGLPVSANLQAVKIQTLPPLKAMLKEQGLQLGSPIYIRIFKASKALEIWIKKDNHYTLSQTYPICAYSGTLGPKLKEGDKQSPEGFYSVNTSQMHPTSRYHLAFNIGFPNAYDRSHNRTGSYLMVHGNCVSIGCYAMTNKGIEDIYLLADAALTNGQTSFQVHIFPFHMTAQNMHIHKDSPWLGFWTNLKEGYDAFEAHKIPPHIQTALQHYVVTEALAPTHQSPQ